MLSYSWRRSGFKLSISWQALLKLFQVLLYFFTIRIEPIPFLPCQVNIYYAAAYTMIVSECSRVGIGFIQHRLYTFYLPLHFNCLQIFISTTTMLFILSNFLSNANGHLTLSRKPEKQLWLEKPCPLYQTIAMALANDTKLGCTFKLTFASVSLHSKLQLSDYLLYGMIKFKVMLPYLDIHLLHRKHTLFAFVWWGVTSWLESESRHMDGVKTNPNVCFVSQNLIGYVKI